MHGNGDALIAATGGHVTQYENGWKSRRATIRYADGRVVELNALFEGNGLNDEAAHFWALICARRLESLVWRTRRHRG